MKLKENEKIPNSEIYILENGEPTKKKIEELLKNKKAVIFGLPGAYTSVCSAKHLPGYVNMHQQYKDKGIDYIICMSVNDPFVMNAWGKENNVGDKIIMMGDPFLNFTRAIGAEVDKSGRGLGIRSNRYTMFVDNMKVIKLQEEKDTGSCEISAAENFVKLFKKEKQKAKMLKDTNIIALELSVSNKIGLNVEIQNTKRNKGKISFEYKDLDQLNKIIDIIKSNY